MTNAAFIFGHRDFDASYGVFIAPPGVDAANCATNQLLLSITNKSSQVIQRGQLTTFPQTIALGLTTFVPVILIQDYFTPSVSGPIAGYVRPGGNYWMKYLMSVTVAADYSTMNFISSGPIIPSKVGYLVFSKGV